MRKSKIPKARRRTTPKSASRIITGLGVPHLLPVNRRVVMKNTSALNGEWNPYFHPPSRVSTGMFSVTSVCLPGVKQSPYSPRCTNWATWLSRTINCAPFLIAFSWLGNRHASVSRVSSLNSMISSNSPLMKPRMSMVWVRLV